MPCSLLDVGAIVILHRIHFPKVGQVFLVRPGILSQENCPVGQNFFHEMCPNRLSYVTGPTILFFYFHCFRQLAIDIWSTRQLHQDYLKLFCSLLESSSELANCHFKFIFITWFNTDNQTLRHISSSLLSQPLCSRVSYNSACKVLTYTYNVDFLSV